MRGGRRLYGSRGGGVAERGEGVTGEALEELGRESMEACRSVVEDWRLRGEGE